MFNPYLNGHPRSRYSHPTGSLLWCIPDVVSLELKQEYIVERLDGVLAVVFRFVLVDHVFYGEVGSAVAERSHTSIYVTVPIGHVALEVPVRCTVVTDVTPGI